MAIYQSMSAFLAAHPISSENIKNETYNRVFRFWCAPYKFMGNEFACWCAIQHFKTAPSKRLAIFITETWLGEDDVAPSSTRDQSILGPVNKGSAGSTFTKDKRNALLTKTKDLKAVKTWRGKLANWNDRARMAVLDRDMFSDLEHLVNENFSDVLHRERLDSDTVILANAAYAVSLRNDLPKLQAATLPTNAMGLW